MQHLGSRKYKSVNVLPCSNNNDCSQYTSTATLCFYVHQGACCTYQHPSPTLPPRKMFFLQGLKPLSSIQKQKTFRQKTKEPKHEMTGRNGCETMTHKQGNMQICADCQKCFCFFCLKSDFDVSQVSTWKHVLYSFYNLYNSHVSYNHHGLAQVSDFRRLCCMVHDIIKAFHPPATIQTLETGPHSCCGRG